MIILATGFDAGSGALTRIDIRGRDGRSLKDEWSRDIRTTMGLQVHGYPEPLHDRRAAGAIDGALQHDHLPSAAGRVDQRLHRVSQKDHLSVIEPTKRRRMPGSRITMRLRTRPS